MVGLEGLKFTGVFVAQVSEMSNFERYERELQTGKLQWGHVLRSYVHGGAFPNMGANTL